jgi:hypothetical protein
MSLCPNATQPPKQTWANLLKTLAAPAEDAWPKPPGLVLFSQSRFSCGLRAESSSVREQNCIPPIYTQGIHRLNVQGNENTHSKKLRKAGEKAFFFIDRSRLSGA